jgi:hypothetical protein
MHVFRVQTWNTDRQFSMVIIVDLALKLVVSNFVFWDTFSSNKYFVIIYIDMFLLIYELKCANSCLIVRPQLKWCLIMLSDKIHRNQ